MEIFLFYEMRKKGGNKKRVVYTRGGSCTLHFFKVWEHTLGLSLSSAPPSGESTWTGTSPTTKFDDAMCNCLVLLIISM
jgi:hypothetical protein